MIYEGLYNAKSTSNIQSNAWIYDIITINLLIVLNRFLIAAENNWKQEPMNWGNEFINEIWNAENCKKTAKADRKFSPAPYITAQKLPSTVDSLRFFLTWCVFSIMNILNKIKYIGTYQVTKKS